MDATVERRTCHEPYEMGRILPGVEFQVVPTVPGPFECSVSTIRLGSVALHCGWNTPFMAFARTCPGKVLVQIPLAGAEALTLNGVAGFTGIVGTYGSGADLLRTSLRPCRHSAVVLPAETVDALLEPPTESALLRPGVHAYLRADPARWDCAARIICAAEETATANPGVFAEAEARRALRDALLGAVRDLLRAGADERVLRAPRSTAARRRLVAAADEFLRSHVDRPIYTEDLCDALGTSASALAEAFHAVFAVSPHRFLKLRRLSLVRAALATRKEPFPLVKSVALSHGFWHLGQFAHDYRAAFGESPSETLRRVGGTAESGEAGRVLH